MTSTAWPLSPLPSSCCLSEPPPPGPPLPCLSPPPLQRTKSWLATRLSVVTQYAFSFLPGQENRSLHALSEEHVQRGKRLGREKAGPAPPPPPLPRTHPDPGPLLLSAITPHPAQGPGRVSLWAGLRAASFSFGEVPSRRPTCGHELKQGAFVSSHLLPSGAHSIPKWQLKEGPQPTQDITNALSHLVPIQTPASWTGVASGGPPSRWPEPALPWQTKRRGSTPPTDPPKGRRERPLGRSQVSRVS